MKFKDYAKRETLTPAMQKGLMERLQINEDSEVDPVKMARHLEIYFMPDFDSLVKKHNVKNYLAKGLMAHLKAEPGTKIPETKFAEAYKQFTGKALPFFKDGGKESGAPATPGNQGNPPGEGETGGESTVTPGAPENLSGESEPGGEISATDMEAKTGLFNRKNKKGVNN